MSCLRAPSVMPSSRHTRNKSGYDEGGVPA